MTSALLVVANRVLRQLVRDRRTLAILVIQPIVIIAVFGYAFGGDVTDARVGIANLDRGTLGGRVLERLDPETVDVVRYATGAEAEAALRRGDVLVALVIPSNFTRNFETLSAADPETPVIEVYEDNTNPQVTGAVLEALSDALEEAVEDETGRDAGIEIDERVVFGREEARNLDFFTPGIAAYATFQLGSMLTVVTIVKERTLGTLPRVLASPARRWEVVFGYTAAFTILSVVQSALILAIATFVFRAPAEGSLALALVSTMLVGMVALGFGILVSGLARSEFQAVQSVFLFSFPMLFLSGVFAPAESLPALLRPLMRAVPLSYAVHALREVLNHGRGVATIGGDLVVLGAFALVFLAVATVTFGRKS